MLCLIANVGRIESSDYKISDDFLDPAQDTLLNKDQDVLQISHYCKSFIL